MRQHLKQRAVRARARLPVRRRHVAREFFLDAHLRQRVDASEHRVVRVVAERRHAHALAAVTCERGAPSPRQRHGDRAVPGVLLELEPQAASPQGGDIASLHSLRRHLAVLDAQRLHRSRRSRANSMSAGGR